MSYGIGSEIAIIIIALAGLALIVQARKTASKLMLIALGMVAWPPLLGALLPLLQQNVQALPDVLGEWVWIEELSPWPLPIFLTLLVLMLLRVVLGRAAIDQMMGTLLADIVRALVLLPFRILGSVLQRLWRP